MGTEGASGTSKLGRTVVAALRVLLLVTWVTVVVAWLVVELFAPFNRLTGLLAFSPPVLGPMLLVGLALPCVGVRALRRPSVGMMVTAVLLICPGIPLRTHYPQPSQVPGLRIKVLTCNRGQHQEHSILDFIRETQPDLIAIQDAYAPRSHDPAAYPLPYSARSGDFWLLSKYPIYSTEVFMVDVERYDRKLRIKTKLKSMRHVVKMEGRDLAVYNLHMPTPRFALTGKSEGGTVAADHWAEQRSLIQQALERMESDPLPVIALGDWNVPARGPLYRRMTRKLTDAHAEAGIGHGFTAPGDMRGWWSLGKSWLRLDYILSSGEWEPMRCVTEPASKAQHGAVFAELRLR